MLIASNVSLRKGTRVSHHQGRFGSLTGARQPDTKGRLRLAGMHPELATAYPEHPIELVRRWAVDLAHGEIDAAMALYAPDAEIVIGERRAVGRRAIRALLEEQQIVGSRRPVQARGTVSGFETIWDPADRHEPAWIAYSELDHGMIREQRFQVRALRDSAGLTAQLAFPIEVVVRGPVEKEAVAYARQRLSRLSNLKGEPVLFARVKLSQMTDPARTRPALCEVEVDLNGHLIRAHHAAPSMHEVIDLVQRRLYSVAERRSKRRAPSSPARPDEWHHRDLRTARPEYFDRPVEERQLVRHKTVAPDEMTLDEAIVEMGQLDFDFYLFRDLASGNDCLLARQEAEGIQSRKLELRQLDGVASPITAAAADVVPSPLPAPTLSIGEAIERLNLEGGRFVFFRQARTGTGAVVYRRYDGHYGLISYHDRTEDGSGEEEVD